MSNTTPNGKSPGCGGYVVLFVLFLLMASYYCGWNHITPDTLHMKLPAGLNLSKVGKTDIGQAIAHAAMAGSTKKHATVAKAGTMVGSPTLSASQMQHILDKANSPVSSTFGQTLYDLGQHYSVNSSYGLFFFKEESNYGKLGAAVSRHNFGNIVCTPGYPSCDGPFRTYGSWEEGAADWFKLMASHTYYGHTIEDITNLYAPANDGNNPTEYAALARSTVARWQAGSTQP